MQKGGDVARFLAVNILPGDLKKKIIFLKRIYVSHGENAQVKGTTADINT